MAQCIGGDVGSWRCYCFVMVLSSCMLTACGGPDFHFDPQPVPGWVRELNSDVQARAIRAIGAAPVTVMVQRDLDLATRDAKNRVAQMFMSQVVSRSSDWSVAVQGGAREGSQQVTQQNIEVRTNVRVEDVTVESSYRDEETRTQYVQVVVDRVAWTRRLQGRLNDTLAQIETSIDGARSDLKSSRPLAAYGKLLNAYQSGREIEPDVIVIDLLNRTLGIRKRLADQKQRLDELARVLRDDFYFVVKISSPDSAVAHDLARTLGTFLNARGFRVVGAKGGGSGAISVTISIGQRERGRERVANRYEMIHEAEGRLQVLEPSGNEVTQLGFALPAGSYLERHVNQKQAATAALVLAADTVAARFRSAFRKTFPEP